MQRLAEVLINAIDEPLQSSYELIYPVLNRESAMQRLGNDIEIYKRILNVFSSKISGNLSAMDASINKRNAQSTFQLAHALKSQAANIGAEALSESAHVLEMKARDNDMVDSERLFEQIKNQVEILLQQL